MTDLFISYSSADREIAETLADDLISLGYTVWWDTHLIAGEQYRNAILEKLDAARAVIVIWTETSISSDWVVAEADRAKSQEKLVSIRSSTLNVGKIPLPFGASYQIVTIENNVALFDALAMRLRTSPAHKIADRTRNIYRIWGSTSWGPKPVEVDQIIQAFQPRHQIEMADRLAIMRVTLNASPVEVMQGWWMLSRLVQGILALFLTAHLESFRNSLPRLNTTAEILPVGLNLIALLNVVDMEEIFNRADREMLSEIALVSEEARLSSLEETCENAGTLERAIAWYPGFLDRLWSQLPDLQHESEFSD